MKKHKLKLIVLVPLTIAIISIAFLSKESLFEKFLPKKSQDIPISLVSKETHSIKTITIDDQLSLVAAAPLDVKLDKDNAMTELYSKNQNGQEELLKKTNNFLSFVGFDGKAVIQTDDGSLRFFAIYEYVSNPSLEQGTQEQKLHGFIYKVDSDGKVKLLYETKYFFDSITYKNGNISVFERFPRDEFNRYPTYLKPYERIKMVYKDGQFIEEDRVSINPIESYQTKKD